MTARRRLLGRRRNLLEQLFAALTLILFDPSPTPGAVSFAEVFIRRQVPAVCACADFPAEGCPCTIPGPLEPAIWIISGGQLEVIPTEAPGEVTMFCIRAELVDAAGNVLTSDCAEPVTAITIP